MSLYLVQSAEEQADNTISSRFCEPCVLFISFSRMRLQTVSAIDCVYCSGRSGQLQMLSFRVAMVLMCKADVEEKYSS